MSGVNVVTSNITRAVTKPWATAARPRIPRSEWHKMLPPAPAQRAARAGTAIANAGIRGIRAGLNAARGSGAGLMSAGKTARKVGQYAAGATALSFVGHSAYRYSTGTGGPFHNRKGDFDIAGIPFI